MSKNGSGKTLSEKLSKGFTFAIIRQKDSPNSATTLDGDVVERQEKLFFPEIGRFVMCAPYDTHFVYDDPAAKKIKYRWSPMCTCGSAAVIVGYNAYREDASPSTGGTVQGEMIVCLIHAQTGRHSDGVQ